MHNYYINHLFTPIAVGGEVVMHRWPPHLTLAGNFFSPATPAEIIAQLREATKTLAAVTTTVVGHARFGEQGEYPVLLLDANPSLMQLHEILATVVERNGLFEVPAYTRSGYRPHVTIQPDNVLGEGDSILVNSFTLFDIDPVGEKRGVLANFNLRP